MTYDRWIKGDEPERRNLVQPAPPGAYRTLCSHRYLARLELIVQPLLLVSSGTLGSQRYSGRLELCNNAIDYIIEDNACHYVPEQQ